MEIAKGRTEFLASKGDDENAMQYARRVELAQLKYPMMLFVPEDRRAFVNGQVLEAKFAAIPSPSWEIPTINFPRTFSGNHGGRVDSEVCWLFH